MAILLNLVKKLTQSFTHYVCQIACNNLVYRKTMSLLVKKSGECHDLQSKQITIYFLKIKCTSSRYNHAAFSPGESG